MQEKHPIDDLFRRSLSEAEATPPASVWEGVVRQRSWGHRLLTRLERRWWLNLMLLLLVGSTTALVLVNAGSRQVAQQGQAGAPEQATVIPSASTAATTPVAEAQLENATAPVVVPSAVMAGTAARGEPSSSVHSDRAIERAPIRSSTPFASTPTDNGGEVSPANGEEEEMVALGSEPEPLVPTAIETRVVETLERQPSRIFSAPVHDSEAPLSNSAMSDYVIGSGNWFLGLEAGIGVLNGSWKGDAPTVESLNSSEDPLDQGHVQLLFGRKWNNGFHVALGVGASRRTSRFLANVEGSQEVIEQTDTTWSPIPLGPSTYYTWDIDTVLLAEPGVDRSYSATNRYSAGRVSVEFGRSWQTRRWLMGVDLGLQAHFSEQRKGQTYTFEEPAFEDSTSSSSSVIAVPFDQDPTDTRTFGLSGSLSMDIGYLLSDRISLHLLPYYQRDLSGKGADPWLRTNAFGAAVRLMYSFAAPARPHSPADR